MKKWKYIYVVVFFTGITAQREKFKFAGLEETQPKLELLGNWMLIIFEKNMLVSEWKLLGRHEEKWEKNLIRINPPNCILFIQNTIIITQHFAFFKCWIGMVFFVVCQKCFDLSTVTSLVMDVSVTNFEWHFKVQWQKLGRIKTLSSCWGNS